MAAIRELSLMDLFQLNNIFFDPLTEVYALSYFYGKILKFPFLAEAGVAPDGRIVGFLVGCRTVEAEAHVGDRKDLKLNNNHGHVGAVSINHDYRCLGLARNLMKRFSDKLEVKDDFYVDLYVRSRNEKALRLYKSLGYEIYRKLYRFYSNDDGYDMRLPLSRDVNRSCLQDEASLFGLFWLLLKYLLAIWNVFCKKKI